MADLPTPPLGFETESIITLHVVFAFLVNTLNGLIEVKQKFKRASPSVTCNWVIVALVIYATASVAEIMLRNRKSTYHLVAGYTRFYASGFAAILLLVILDPILGYIISVLWGGLFAGLTYGSNKELQELLWQTAQLGHDLWTKLVVILGCNGE
ncbi:PROTEIN putative-RELATED [Salix viminalis]|uniref:PROTEIN putative-RELATED n=1 Tax=Salix viminalis TaxID=40686 RepID=A0A9Q0V518_SALVM|nr:PROTEIN putative-RELATED [Salix viminalis]